jgi:hypothetical protein
MRIAFGRTRPGIRSLFHLCAEPDLFLEEWDPESDTEFIHLCADLDICFWKKQTWNQNPSSFMCRTRFGFERTRPEIRTPVHSCVDKN